MFFTIYLKDGTVLYEQTMFIVRELEKLGCIAALHVHRELSDDNQNI